MAANDIKTRRRGAANRLFLEHPHSLGMSWAGHAIGAVRIGVELLGAGSAAIVHAIVPGILTDTAGKTVARIYDHIHQRKAGAARPEDWPDYEI